MRYITLFAVLMMLHGAPLLAAEGDPITLPTTAQAASADENKAQSQANKPSDEGSKKTSDPEQTKEQTKSPAGSKKNEDVFRPTEQISEDFSVAFPVDI